MGGGRAQVLPSQSQAPRYQLGPRRPQVPAREPPSALLSRGWEASEWVCAWGAAKLPVPRSNCFRQEPEDALCGQNSGPTDGRTRDWKVSSGVVPTIPTRLGGLQEGGGQRRLLGGAGRVCPRRGPGNRPQGTPPGSGAAGLKPCGFGFSPRGLRGPVFRLLYLVWGPGAWGQDRPEKASQRVPGAGAPRRHPQRGPPASLGAFH